MTDEELIRLSREAGLLIEKLNQLNRRAGIELYDIAKFGVSNRRRIWVSWVALALDILLTAAMAVGGLLLHSTAEQTQTNTKRIEYNQTIQRQKALCPLYQLFLDSESPQGRAAAPDKLAYDKAFKVIHEGYDALDCKTLLKKK